MDKNELIAQVIYEPYAMGDVIIAAAVSSISLGKLAIACNPVWHDLLLEIFGKSVPVKLYSVYQDYPKSNRANREKLSNLSTNKYRYLDVKKVYCIRGHVRDWLKMKKIFPNANIHISGWSNTFARNIFLLDYMYRCGLFNVSNRYEMWARLLGKDYLFFEKEYLSRKRSESRGKNITAIHLGASWISRQYPHVAELKLSLSRKGFNVVLLAGPNDNIPEGVKAEEVKRVANTELVAEINNARNVVVNDSGPMHLSAYLGIETIVIARVSNIKQWLPPGAKYVVSKSMPRGYSVDPAYCSDSVLSGWPEPSYIASFLEKSFVEDSL